MLNDTDKKNYINIVKNIKFLKYTNKLINKKINTEEDYKDYKKRSIISAIVGGLGIAIAATALPIMLPLAFPFMLTACIVGGMAGLVGLTYSFLSLNCVGKMRQIKENKFEAETSLKKLQKQNIKNCKKNLKSYSKKDIKNNFNKKELKELKKLVNDTEITALNNIMEEKLEEIRSEMAAINKSINNKEETIQNENNTSAEQNVNNSASEQNTEKNIEKVRDIYGNIDTNTEISNSNNNEQLETIKNLEAEPVLNKKAVVIEKKTELEKGNN